VRLPPVETTQLLAWPGKIQRINFAREDIWVLINTFIADGERAARVLADRHRLPIKLVHIENALFEGFSLDDTADLLGLNLTRDSMLLALEEYDFRKFFPVVLAKVFFEDSIIPPGAPQKLEEKWVRHHGQLWQINRNDADPWPSNPHAHNLESGYKLDLSTGKLFFKTRDVGERVSRKDLLAIREKAGPIDLPPLLV
jgi:hypothetical protein